MSSPSSFDLEESAALPREDLKHPVQKRQGLPHFKPRLWKQKLVAGLILFSLVAALVVSLVALRQRQNVQSEAYQPSDLVGMNKHLFIDDALIDGDRSTDYRIEVNPPTVMQKVINTDQPWEKVGYHYYTEVLPYNLPVQGTNYKYILYYGRWSLAPGSGFETGEPNDQGGYYCTAFSNDGLSWTKLNFEGSSKFAGQNTNCLQFTASHNNFILNDPNAATGQRFKLMGGIETQGGAWGVVAYSADGLHFTEVNKRLGPKHIDGKAYGLDSQNVVIWDDELGKYRFYVRGRKGTFVPPRDSRPYRYINLSRTVNYGEITGSNLLAPGKYFLDIVQNQYPLIVNSPEQYRLSTELPYMMEAVPEEMSAWTPGELGTVGIYHSSIFKYPGASDTYLSFPTIYYNYTSNTNPAALNGNDGEFEVQFAASRDGRNWSRYKTIDNNPPYVARGNYSGVRMRMMSMGQGLITEGNNIYQYLIALPRTHAAGMWLNNVYTDITASEANRTIWKNTPNKGGVFLAKQRLDGFASVKPVNALGEATVVTLPFTTTGNTLYINGKTNTGGSIKVAVLSASGQEIPAYSLTNSDVPEGDHINQKVVWNSLSVLPATANTTPIRLKFQLNRAQIFAFKIGTESAPQTHTICQNSQCVSVAGAGANECDTPADCAAPQTHTICQNSQCVSVSGAGANECDTLFDCPGAQTHTTCKGAQCVFVSGVGANECSDSVDCEDDIAPQEPKQILKNPSLSNFGESWSFMTSTPDSVIHVPSKYILSIKTTDKGANGCWYQDVAVSQYRGQRVKLTGGLQILRVPPTEFVPYLALDALKTNGSWQTNYGGTFPLFSVTSEWGKYFTVNSGLITIGDDVEQLRAKFCIDNAPKNRVVRVQTINLVVQF